MDYLFVAKKRSPFCCTMKSVQIIGFFGLGKHFCKNLGKSTAVGIVPDLLQGIIFRDVDSTQNLGLNQRIFYKTRLFKPKTQFLNDYVKLLKSLN